MWDNLNLQSGVAAVDKGKCKKAMGVGMYIKSDTSTLACA